MVGGREGHNEGKRNKVGDKSTWCTRSFFFQSFSQLFILIIILK